MTTDSPVSRRLQGAAAGCAILLLSCGAPEIKPVDLYAEDICSSCRMAVSDHRFAGEIISEEGEVFKFDDLGCLRRFQSDRSEIRAAAVFYKDYHSKVWLAPEAAVVVQTALPTPMGSGLAAFRDSTDARAFLQGQPDKGQ